MVLSMLSSHKELEIVEIALVVCGGIFLIAVAVKGIMMCVEYSRSTVTA